MKNISVKNDGNVVVVDVDYMYTECDLICFEVAIKPVKAKAKNSISRFHNKINFFLSIMRGNAIVSNQCFIEFGFTNRYKWINHSELIQLYFSFYEK
jgi:hypothetical protein